MEPEAQIARDVDAGGASPPHPEELKGRVEPRVGGRAVLAAAGRATPAGLVTVGIAAAAVPPPAAAPVRAARTRRR